MGRRSRATIGSILGFLLGFIPGAPIGWLIGRRYDKKYIRKQIDIIKSEIDIHPDIVPEAAAEFVLDASESPSHLHISVAALPIPVYKQHIIASALSNVKDPLVRRKAALALVSNPYVDFIDVASLTKSAGLTGTLIGATLGAAPFLAPIILDNRLPPELIGMLSAYSLLSGAGGGATGHLVGEAIHSKRLLRRARNMPKMPTVNEFGLAEALRSVESQNADDWREGLKWLPIKRDKRDDVLNRLSMAQSETERKNLIEKIVNSPEYIIQGK